MPPSSPAVDIALIAPFCADSNSRWFSPGRQRKLSQVMAVLNTAGYRWQGLSTCPASTGTSTEQAAASDASLPLQSGHLKSLCHSDFWPLRLLDTLVHSLGIGRRWGHQQPMPVLWLYNTRISEALVALVLLKLQRHTNERPRVVLQLEDLPAARQANAGIRGAIDRWSTTTLARHASAALCVSEPVAQAFQAISGFPRSRIQLLPPLLDAAAQAVFNARSEPFQDETITIVYAGGYDIEKGVLDLLSAFQCLQSKRYRLLLFGPIPASLHAQLANQDRLELRGLVPLPELFTAYSQADVVVNPHRPIAHSSYIFPFKLVELLASGALPLSTPMPGLKAYGLPDDCLFQGPDQLTQRLQLAPQIWCQHRSSLQQLARQVRHQHSLEQAQQTIRQAIEALP